MSVVDAADRRKQNVVAVKAAGTEIHHNDPIWL